MPLYPAIFMGFVISKAGLPTKSTSFDRSFAHFSRLVQERKIYNGLPVCRFTDRLKDDIYNALGPEISQALRVNVRRWSGDRF